MCYTCIYDVHFDQKINFNIVAILEYSMKFIFIDIVVKLSICKILNTFEQLK
jgi:hypothetical protein